MEIVIHKIYQTIGDFFTGTPRRRLFYAITLIWLFISSYFSITGEIVIEADKLNLVFSTIIQAIIALAALLGVGAFFKLEIYRNEENQIVQSAFSQDTRYNWLPGRLMDKTIITGEDLLRELNVITEKENPAEQKAKILKTRLDYIFLGRDLTRSYALNFTIYNFFVVILSLLFLLSSNFLSENYLGIPSLFLITFLTGYCLFLATKGITDALYH